MKLLVLIAAALVVVPSIASISFHPDFFQEGSLIARGNNKDKHQQSKNGVKAPGRDGLKGKSSWHTSDEEDIEALKTKERNYKSRRQKPLYRETEAPSDEIEDSYYMHDDDPHENIATIYFGSYPNQRVSDHLRLRHAAWPEEVDRIYVPHGDPKWKDIRRTNAQRGFSREELLVLEEKGFASAHPWNEEMQTLIFDTRSSQLLEGNLIQQASAKVVKGYEAQIELGLPLTGGLRFRPIAPDQVEDLRVLVGPDASRVYPRARKPKNVLPEKPHQLGERPGYYPGGPASREDSASRSSKSKGSGSASGGSIPSSLKHDPEYGNGKFPQYSLPRDGNNNFRIVEIKPGRTTGSGHSSGPSQKSGHGSGRNDRSGHKRRSGVTDLAGLESTAANSPPPVNASITDDAQSHVQDYLNLFYDCQNNASQAIWPFILDMTNGSNSSLVYFAAWSIYLEMSSIPISSMGGFSRGLNSMAWEHDQMANDSTISDNVKDQVDFVRDILLDSYNTAYINGSAAVNATGLLLDLELLDDLFAADNQSFPDSLLAIDENDPILMEDFFTSYSQVPVDLGNMTIVFINNTGGGNTTALIEGDLNGNSSTAANSSVVGGAAIGGAATVSGATLATGSSIPRSMIEGAATKKYTLPSGVAPRKGQ